jgi:hypothetical protein
MRCKSCHEYKDENQFQISRKVNGKVYRKSICMKCWYARYSETVKRPYNQSTMKKYREKTFGLCRYGFTLKHIEEHQDIAIMFRQLQFLKKAIHENI